MEPWEVVTIGFRVVPYSSMLQGSTSEVVSAWVDAWQEFAGNHTCFPASIATTCYNTERGSCDSCANLSLLSVHFWNGLQFQAVPKIDTSYTIPKLPQLCNLSFKLSQHARSCHLCFSPSREEQLTLESMWDRFGCYISTQQVISSLSFFAVSFLPSNAFTAALGTAGTLFNLDSLNSSGGATEAGETQDSGSQMSLSRTPMTFALHFSVHVAVALPCLHVLAAAQHGCSWSASWS